MSTNNRKYYLGANMVNPKLNAILLRLSFIIRYLLSSSEGGYSICKDLDSFALMYYSYAGEKRFSH